MTHTDYDKSSFSIQYHLATWNITVARSLLHHFTFLSLYCSFFTLPFPQLEYFQLSLPSPTQSPFLFSSILFHHFSSSPTFPQFPFSFSFLSNFSPYISSASSISPAFLRPFCPLITVTGYVTTCDHALFSFLMFYLLIWSKCQCVFANVVLRNGECKQSHSCADNGCIVLCVKVSCRNPRLFMYFTSLHSRHLSLHFYRLLVYHGHSEYLHQFLILCLSCCPSCTKVVLPHYYC